MTRGQIIREQRKKERWMGSRNILVGVSFPLGLAFLCAMAEILGEALCAVL